MNALWHLQRSAAYGIMLLIFVSSPAEGGSGAPAKADTGDSLSLRIAVAESELAVAIAEERLADWKNRGRTRLYREGHGSWIENAKAREAHQVAVVRKTYAERYLDWLRTLGTSQTTSDPRQRSVLPVADRIELMIPGSRAVIGWVRPMALPPEERARFLELMTQRAEASRIDTSAIDHATQMVEASKLHVGRLRSVSGPAAEVEHAELKRDLAAAELRRITANHDLREFDYQYLNQLGSITPFPRLNGDQETSQDVESFPVVLHRHAREVLDLELGQKGIVQAGGVMAERSELAQYPVKRLGDSPLNNFPDRNDARRAWLSQWMLTLNRMGRSEERPDSDGLTESPFKDTNESIFDPADDVPILPAAIPNKVKGDPGRCKRLLDLIQVWHQASTDVAVAKCQLEFHNMVSERVSNVVRRDQEVPAGSRNSTELMRAELRIAEENRQLVNHLLRQFLELPPQSGEPAWELRLLSDEASEILSQLAKQRAISTRNSTGDEVARNLARRDKLIELNKKGLATSLEVRAAERLVLQCELHAREHTQQQRLAELDVQLMTRILDLRAREATLKPIGGNR